MNEPSLLTPAELLAHWLEHRRLTRRVLAAFPDDQLFTFVPAPPMRSFGELAWEVHLQTDQVRAGLVEDNWNTRIEVWVPFTLRSDLLSVWNALSIRLKDELPGVPPQRYARTVNCHRAGESGLAAAFGEIDNEVHHRGQGKVYLLLLGTAPPDFWERS